MGKHVWGSLKGAEVESGPPSFLPLQHHRVFLHRRNKKKNRDFSFNPNTTALRKGRSVLYLYVVAILIASSLAQNLCIYGVSPSLLSLWYPSLQCRSTSMIHLLWISKQGRKSVSWNSLKRWWVKRYSPSLNSVILYSTSFWNKPSWVNGRGLRFCNQTTKLQLV